MKSPSDSAAPAVESQSINLRDPYLAAFLAWLIPGAGHFYQRRWGKGGLFMVCILGTFFVGLWMGQGRVVYASWRHDDQRYPYICQIGVGLPAVPAIVQSLKMGGDPPRAPLWGGFMAPPLLYDQKVPADWAAKQVADHVFDERDFPELASPDKRAFVSYLPIVGRAEFPHGTFAPANSRDPYNQLSDWNNRMGPFFELGTVYTLIAGLLNILAIYDAWGGPVSAGSPTPSPESEPEQEKPESA